MRKETAFQDLMAGVRRRDQRAAAEVLRLYEPAIRRAVRVRLVNRELRRVIDSMDICQSVFGSFFVHAALGQYELRTAQQLLRLLITMSHKKLTDRIRREGAARRDYRRRQSISSLEKHLLARDSDPGDQVSGRELLEEARRRLSPVERRLAQRRAEGHDWAQIAAELHQDVDVLRKRLARAVARVMHELGLVR
jgi:RNA polymerase sigma-70 factor (ECF subfamily)